MPVPGTSPSSASAPRSRTHGLRTRRYEPTPLYLLAKHLKRQGYELRSDHGPWRPSSRRLRRPGRNGERTIPLVTNGVVTIAVDTAEHAVDLSGFLNAAGVDHLNPVPNLCPPGEDLIES
jgi:hypothetical protein